MKCEGCKHIYYPYYEESYTECEVFGDEIPEKYERKDGKGCICNERTLQKLLRLNEEAWAKECEEMVEFFEHKESNCRKCKYEDEADGQFCYECVKDMVNHFEPKETADENLDV